MPLSPQEIAEIRKQYNIQPAKTPASPGGTDEAYRNARTERLKALRTQQPAQAADQEQEQGFFSRVGSDLKKRANEAFDTFGEAARGEITPVETGIRVVGQGLAATGDVVGEGLKSVYKTVVPEKAQNVIESGVGKAAQAVGLPKAIEKYEKFAEAHPRAAKNVEAIANIGLNLPGVAGAKVVGEAAEVAAKQGVKAAAKSVSKKALRELEGQYSSIVRLAKKTKQSEAEWGKNTAKLLAEEGGVDLGVLPDKTLDTYSSAVPQIKTKLDEASQAVKKVIAESGVYGNIDEAERAALKANEVNRKLGTVYKQNQEQIKREFAAIRDNYKDVATITEEGETLLPLSVIDEAKSGAWDRAFSGAPLATSKAAQDTDFAIGKSLQKTIEDGIEDAPIKEMNRKAGDYAEALDVLRNAHGMVLPGGRIGKYAAQVVGAGIGGLTGGAPGGIAGYFVADKLADALANPATRTSYLRKILEKAGATKNQSKEVVEEALKILDSMATKQKTKSLMRNPSDMSKLLTEAGKYKTADEFVRSQGDTFFRGGAGFSHDKVSRAGVSITRGRTVAEEFAKQKGGAVEEVVVSPSAKTIDYSKIPGVRFKHLNDYSPELDVGNKQIWTDLEGEYQKAVDWAVANGYDVVKLPLEGELRVVNPSMVKTKKQLTDIWHQAKND